MILEQFSDSRMIFTPRIIPNVHREVVDRSVALYGYIS